MPIIPPQLVKYYIEEHKPSIILLTTFICSKYKAVCRAVRCLWQSSVMTAMPWWYQNCMEFLMIDDKYSVKCNNNYNIFHFIQISIQLYFGIKDIHLNVIDGYIIFQVRSDLKITRIFHPLSGHEGWKANWTVWPS